MAGDDDISYSGDEEACYMSMAAFRRDVLFSVHPWRSCEAERVIDKWIEDAGGGCLELTMEHIEQIRDWSNKEAKEKRRYIPVEIRRAVMERDGYKCRACGATENPSLDHIKPFTFNGRHTRANLQVLCRSCNSRKRTMTQKEWEVRCGR